MLEIQKELILIIIIHLLELPLNQGICRTGDDKKICVHVIGASCWQPAAAPTYPALGPTVEMSKCRREESPWPKESDPTGIENLIAASKVGTSRLFNCGYSRSHPETFMGLSEKFACVCVHIQYIYITIIINDNNYNNNNYYYHIYNWIIYIYIE